MKRLLYVCVLFLIIFGTAGCVISGGTGSSGGGNGSNAAGGGSSSDGTGSNGSEDENGTEDEYFTVSVLCDEGISVAEGSVNPLKVRAGEDASFVLDHGNNVVIESISEGKYDYSSRKLTLTEITEDIRVFVYGESTEHDSSVTCYYQFGGMGINDDVSSRENGIYSLGVGITVNAGNDSRSFVGWSIGAGLEYGGRLVSSERNFSFKISADMLDEGLLYIYSNYSEENVYYYDLNGGSLDTEAGNWRSDHYETTTLVQNPSLVKVALSSKYFDATGCASTFYDDGIFSREGYILTEYNTKADGSGEGYSLGSKFPLNLESNTLYCIWSRESNASHFEYESITIKLPPGVRAENAPHWVEEGIKITSYNGDDTTVVIPESINGKTVTAIAGGAFKNKSLQTLVMGRRIIRIEDGAFTGCSNLEKIHYPDGIYDITNDAFDRESWDGVKHFYVNATLAPRFSRSLEGAYALKLTRLLYYSDMPQIIVIAGSSAFQGLSTEYLEALLDGEYNVVNFGTTRTTQGYMYLEAMGYYADEKDTVLYAPENSAYMMGEPRLYWKTLRDMEGMYNIFRHVDISGYDNVLGAFAEFNRGDPTAIETLGTPRYQRNPSPYELIVDTSNINIYGEYILPSERGQYVNDQKYQDVYKLTFNNRFKSMKEGSYLNSDPNEDYYTSENWCDITEPYYRDNMNRAVYAAKSGGARVYFTFCPSDGSKLSDEVKEGGDLWLSDYDSFILDTYVFDGILGSSRSYIYNHKYFYNNAFHLNDYGRTYRTYDMYCDLAELFGLDSVKSLYGVGTDFEGCLFEQTSDGEPIYKSEEHFVNQ